MSHRAPPPLDQPASMRDRVVAWVHRHPHIAYASLLVLVGIVAVFTGAALATLGVTL